MPKPKIQNMEEFAAFSGISRPTLSKYFNDPDSVRAATRAKVEDALRRCDYRPNVFAINQNRKQTKNIGIVVPYLADPFFGEIARRIETLVLAAGYRPILRSSHGDPALEIENLTSLHAIKCAGVLLAPLGRTSNRSAIEKFCDAVPTVNFDAHLEGVGHAFVGHNNQQAVLKMLEYLCSSGQPPVFFEMQTPPNPNAGKRRKAYLEGMASLGHAPEIIQVEGEGWELEEFGYRGAQRALETGRIAQGTVFCSNDRLAIGFLAAAYEAGIRVGSAGDCTLRVAGHDNHPFSRFTCPRLTTISHNYDAIARGSVEATLSLIDRAADDDTRQTTFFDGELIIRDSA